MKFTIFDIETLGNRKLALENAEPFKLFEPLPPFDEKAVKVGNLKNPEKIAEKIEAECAAYPQKCKEHKQKYETEKLIYEANIVEKAALDPFCASVVAIGIKTDEKETIIQGEEADILRQFWELWGSSSNVFVGWNSNSFDIPFLVRRSWALGVIVPDVMRGRFIDSRFIDLMEMFAVGVYGYRAGLDKVAKFFGVQGKFTGDIEGKTFAQHFLGDDPVMRKQAEQYLLCDLRATWEIAERMLNSHKEQFEEESEFC